MYLYFIFVIMVWAGREPLVRSSSFNISSSQTSPRASLEEGNETAHIFLNEKEEAGLKEYSTAQAEVLRQQSKSNGSRGEVPSWEDVRSFLVAVTDEYKGITKLKLLGKSALDRSIYVLRILKPSTKSQVATIMVEGGIHAQEFASTASALYLIRQLLEDGGKLIEDVQWFIIPVLNPDGYHYSTVKSKQWVKNRRKTNATVRCKGVDLNRNFETGWDNDLSLDPCQAYYSGPKPFSEKETTALRKFLNDLGPYPLDAYVAVHSCGKDITFPYAYTSELPRMEREKLTKVGRAMAFEMKKVENRDFEVLSSSKLGVVGGSSGDYVYEHLSVPYVFTVMLGDEIIDNRHDHYHCNQSFSSERMRTLGEEFFVGMKVLAMHISFKKPTDEFGRYALSSSIRGKPMIILRGGLGYVFITLFFHCSQ